MSHTTDQSLINNISINVQRAIGEWLPHSMVAPMNQIVSEFLIDCMRQNEDDSNFDSLCLNTLKSFAFDEQAITILKNAMLDENWLVYIEGKAGLV